MILIILSLYIVLVKNNPKDFGNDQVSVKSDLSEIKLGDKKLADQENKIKSVSNVFNLKSFFRDYSLLLS